nr:MAG TPA: hypothetical protein [Bacteriophage sp.]
MNSQSSNIIPKGTFDRSQVFMHSLDTIQGLHLS